jgi:F-type H+-transporting ATPase subunit epsilon
MDATLKLEIITPEATTFSENVDMVTLPGVEGEMGIYPQHVPLMTEVVPGEVIVRQGSREFSLVIGGGFAEITDIRVAILTDMAIKADDVDEAKAEEARQAAEARLREKLSPDEVASVNAAMARSLAQLQVKRRHRHHS